MPDSTKWLAAVVATVAVLLSTTIAAADEGESVAIEVRTIAAGIDTERVDPAVEDIERRLRRAFSDYTSFEQLERTTRVVDRGDSTDFLLPTDDALTLHNKGFVGDRVKLGLVLRDRLDTTLRATPSSTFFQAGLRYGNRMLVLAITVEVPEK